jgi:outer membrane receptor protein involved in Fe transport
MKKKVWAVTWLLCICILVKAQMIQGFVIEETPDGKRLAVTGAVVGVMNTTNATTTDEKGAFMIMGANPDKIALVVSALGYQTDTVWLKGAAIITITLQPLTLKEVDATAKKATRLELTPRNVEVLNSNDLVKAACCNLSESFENSATVDVNFTDAVSGAKEIRMLGLDGIYTQIMVEDMPGIRGLGNSFGLNYIPGSWMSSIQVNKGAGSVVNGYESMTGQINIEYKKPVNSDLLFVNLYLNQDLRTELNVVSAQKISNKWSSLTAVHGAYNGLKMDLNHDGYLDNPLTKNLDLFNRFTYFSGKVFSFWSGVSVNLEDRVGGSIHFDPGINPVNQNYWGLRLTTERVQAFAKTSFSLPHLNFIGIQYQYVYHHQEGYIGRRDYDGLENFGYINFIYQKTFNKNDDMIKAGASFQLDDVHEQFDTFLRTRTEIVPGVFTEGSLNFGKDKQVMLIGGVRLDYHNIYGPLFSPRLNMKWNILHDLSLRVSGGKGYRVPSIFAENLGYLANNRALVIDPNLGIESAWNYGASLTWKFVLGFREGSISADYYRTDFVKQVVADIENTREVQFYNLNGKSFANALQAEFSYELVKGLDVKLAYKYEPSETQFKEGLMLTPLRPQNRGLFSLQHTTKNQHWRFNTGLNWFGKTRIPSTLVNDIENQRPAESPNWVQLNAQITFKWKKWEVYAGGENLTNFTQKNPIIAGDQPFSNQFDASLIWGPLRGAMAFAGVRFTLK